MNGNEEFVAGTVRCPTLPKHIKCDVYDVASTFKRLLSGLPGGILGSLALFDAFVSIQSQLQAEAESTRTKESRVRARLIALAIATVKSKYRRELICAVFGLLSLVGRAAETARREDSRGRPLPTSDLMGYGPLGVIFGPLLVGEQLNEFKASLVGPRGSIIIHPISPIKSRKGRQKDSSLGDSSSELIAHVDTIKVTSSVAEMIITHWRDVVRHMKNLEALKTKETQPGSEQALLRRFTLRPCASESFTIRRPSDWRPEREAYCPRSRSRSPTPLSGRFLSSKPRGRKFSLKSINSDTDLPFYFLYLLFYMLVRV